MVTNVKFSSYGPGGAQMLGKGVALHFHDRGTGRWWVVSTTRRPHSTPAKDMVSIVKEAEWDPGPVWKGGKFLSHRESTPDRPTLGQLLHVLSYPTHVDGN